MPHGEDPAARLYDALTKVPGMTRDQVARLFGHDAEHGARAIRELTRSGALYRTELLARRTTVEQPFYSSSGSALFSPYVLERLLRERWNGEPERTDVFSLGPFRRPQQVSHELGVTDIFLTVRETRPGVLWQSEQEVWPRRGTRVPDGVIVEGGVQTAVDFGGTYKGGKLIELARFYSAHPQYHHFEIW